MQGTWQGHYYLLNAMIEKENLPSKCDISSVPRGGHPQFALVLSVQVFLNDKLLSIGLAQTVSFGKEKCNVLPDGISHYQHI